MNREQKRAWAIVISMSLAALLGAAALVSRHLEFDTPTIVLFVAAGVIQGAGVVAALRFKPDKGAVTSDERDKQIEKNAHLAGFGAVYLFVIVASFAPIAILGEKGSLPTTWCPALLIGAGFCQAYAMSVATLIQYGWTGTGEQQ
jgi:hypothetical protein